MKRNNATILLALFLLTLALASTTGCKKDADVDLTTDIVGVYNSGSGSGAVKITVTKIDNSTISVVLKPATAIARTFTNTKMHSATTFTLNTITQTENGEQIEYSGSGSYSANNIVIQLHKKTPTTENDYTYTGTK